METAPFVRTQDKVTFVGIILLMNFFTYLYAKENDPRFYTLVAVVVPSLIFIRFVSYKSKGWHYYLIDFCYMAVTMMLILITVQR